MTFLRPALLLLLVPVAGLVVFLLKRGSAELRIWKGRMAPHLLDHLTVGGKGGAGPRPAHLLGVALALAVVAAAGPSWRSEPSPFTQDEATLVAVVDLSKTMEAKDVRPSRYERAIQKVRDLLDTRTGARTGLVAYAGTAHLVLPPTRDAELLTSFLEALSPKIMPKPGKNAAAALATAEELLAKEGTPGTILFLTDGAVPKRDGKNQVAVLAMGRNLEIDAPGAYVTPVTVDDADVRRIARRVKTHFTEAKTEDPAARPEDGGVWLMAPLLLLVLLWFRPGWVVTWD